MLYVLLCIFSAVTVRYLTKRFIGEYSSSSGKCNSKMILSILHNIALTKQKKNLFKSHLNASEQWFSIISFYRNRIFIYFDVQTSELQRQLNKYLSKTKAASIVKTSIALES